MRIEDQVVPLELARLLKEDGYPQENSYFSWRAADFKGTRWSLTAPHMVLDRAFRPSFAAPTAAEIGEVLPGEIYLPYKNGKSRAYPHRLCIRRHLNDSVWDIKYVSGRSYQDISERGATEAEARARMWLRLKRIGLLTA